MSKVMEALESLGSCEIGRSNNGRLIQHAHDTVEYNLLLKALTPPTADEVCEALEEHLEVSVFYDKESCSFYTKTYFEGTKWAQTIIEYFNNGYIQIHGILPLKFVTLIGRFYEGLGE